VVDPPSSLAVRVMVILHSLNRIPDLIPIGHFHTANPDEPNRLPPVHKTVRLFWEAFKPHQPSNEALHVNAQGLRGGCGWPHSDDFRVVRLQLLELVLLLIRNMVFQLSKTGEQMLLQETGYLDPTLAAGAILSTATAILAVMDLIVTQS
jgi:hypothetical protein